MINKIILGTAQLGTDYGLTNNNLLNKKKSLDILHKALDSGINMLDTSPDYSNYKIINNFNLSRFKIISKFSIKNKKSFSQEVRLNLENLKIKKFEAILFRTPTLLKENSHLWHQAKLLQDKNLISKIGFTVYKPDELKYILQYYKPDIVQLPYNIFDKRFLNTGWLDNLYNLGIETHIRSAFLQGLLLSNIKDIPNFFQKYSDVFSRYEQWLISNNISKLEACLNLYYKDERVSKLILE